MINYARLYNFYKNPIIKLLRFAIFLSLILLIIQNAPNWFFLSTNLKLSVSSLLIFLDIEIFFYFKIGKIQPLILIGNNSGNIYDSFTLDVLSIYLNKNIKDIVESLLKKEEVKFILQKANIEKGEIKIINVDKDDLGKLSFKIAKNNNGRAVTAMDVVVSYFLLTEEKTKLMFGKKLKKEELVNILYWGRSAFTDEEIRKPFRIQFWGEGIGEDWVSGWTLETKKYMHDVTSEVLSKKPLLLGRNEEYNDIVASLSQNKSVVLIGEVGSGKTSLVETLAFESFVGNLKGKLYHQRFFKLFVDTLLAGVENQGELEERLENIIAEVSHAGNIIIFIPDFENILGSATFHTDLSGFLIQYLQNRSIRIVATSTPTAYKKFAEPLKSLTDVFEIIKFAEPLRNTVFQMLLQKASIIEKRSKVSLSYKAIEASLEWANKYSQDRVLPGAAVVLLEDAANMAALAGKKIVEEEDVIEKVEKKTKITIASPGIEEKDLLLSLEKEIHKKIVDQENAISAIAKGIRRIRSGLANKQKPISFLFLGPTGVGKTATAKALSSLYFGGEDRMIRLDMSEYSTEDSVKRLLGFSGGSLDFIDKIYENPFSLVLLDEFEKANDKIINLFLQVLDDGRLTDNREKTVSFSDAIIIATSNAGSEFIREGVKKGEALDKKGFKDKLMEFLQEKEIFRPELLNRFDDVIVFEPLGRKEIAQITKLILDQFVKAMLDKDIVLEYDDKIVSKIIKEGFNEQFGARPIRRYIQDTIEDLAAQKLLKNEIKRGDKMSISVDNTDNIALSAL